MVIDPNMSKTSPKIGVLALQGDFPEHLASLKRHDVQGLEIRTLDDLSEVSALIIPGGESTVMAKLLSESGLDKEIIRRVREGMPIWGTCAGAIILSRKVLSNPPFSGNLGLVDVEIERNSYGRQTESFGTELQGQEVNEGKIFSVLFIRSPRILAFGQKVQTLLMRQNSPVLLRQGKKLISMFHSEMKYPDPVLKYFLS